MKLFKRGPFRSRRGEARPEQAPVDDDKSIGTNLSEADRFDILIPLRSTRVLPLFGRDEGSEISSITTDDRRSRNGSRRRAKKSPRGVVASCCYGSSTTKADDDYVVAPTTAKGGPPDTIGGTPLAPVSSTSSFFDFTCCGPAPIEEKAVRVKKTRGSRNSSAASLAPTNSLFDTVMSDDEDRDPVEVITVSSQKRRLWKVRGLPWRKNRNI
jgi:hypothetical protein